MASNSDRGFGGSGPKPITGTTAVTGNFYVIEAGGNGATISAIVGLAGTWTGFVLAPGQPLFAGAGGNITSVTLSAGAAIGYEA